MTWSKLILALFAITFAVATAAFAGSGDRIYGKITTVDGDVFEGLIRWDKNEGNWVDVLNGNKELSKRNLKKSSKSARKKYRDRDVSINILGLKVGGSSSGWSSWSSEAQSGMRFGHIKALEVIGDDEVLVILKSGEEVELSGGSTDIGDGIREIVIEDDREGEIELVWDDIEMVEFMDTPGDLKSSLGERLFGTLTTRRGDEYTGYVCWDVDELFTKDILDGDYKGRRRKIKFGKIDTISRYSSSGAEVIFTNGDEMVLRGTNDVDDSNSGITISDPGFGQVTVKWDEFDELKFHDPTVVARYSDFDGGRPLSGTVFTEDGDSYTGSIRWDNDEEYTWEILDGEFRDMEFDVEFGLIKSIEKKSYRAVTVTVWDGRSFALRGSNDVNEDNKGIFITMSDDDEVEIDWDEFERVEFKK
jgi:hypothetical protein